MRTPASVPSVPDFDRATAAAPVGSAADEFTVELDAGWSSLAGVHGGYMCAVVVRGAEAHEPGRAVRTLATSFLRPGEVGPAHLVVSDVRRGRSLTTLSIDLVQHDRLVLTSRVTLMIDRVGAEWGELVPPDLPPPGECVSFDFPAAVVNAARVDSAFRPDRPFDPDRARIAGYIRPLEVRPVDAAWLTMACDWFPPPAFARVDAPVGGVSIDYTVHVHRTVPSLGDGDWLAGAFEVTESSGGLAVEHGRITDLKGTVLAESFQTRLTALD